MPCPYLRSKRSPLRNNPSGVRTTVPQRNQARFLPEYGIHGRLLNALDLGRDWARAAGTATSLAGKPHGCARPRESTARGGHPPPATRAASAVKDDAQREKALSHAGVTVPLAEFPVSRVRYRLPQMKARGHFSG